jgi:hypothetical protein
MSKKVFNMAGGRHSAAAYSAFENRRWGSCKATEESFVVSAGSGMQVSISVGDGLIDTGSDYARRIQVTAAEVATVAAASGSFGRLDSVVAYIDNAATPTTGVTDNTNDILMFAVVSGTAAATPLAPSGATIQSAIGSGNPYMILANVLVPQSAVNLSGATFTQIAPAVEGKGGWSALIGLTPVYVSASTFKFTGLDVTKRFGSTTKIRIVQGGVTKYFTATKSVFSTDTTVTVDGDGVYTLSNAPIDAMSVSQADVPVGFPNSFRDEYIANYIASGIVASGDSYGVNKNYSITAGVVYLNGKRLTVAAVSGVTVGASKDRYIDLRDNGDGTATYITNEVSNNAASQALTAGDMRVAIIVSGATTIASVASINQGQQDKVLPIASSVPYAVTDSLGNLICNRAPNPTLIGYRQIVSSAAMSSGSIAQVAGLSVPVSTTNVPTGRKIKVTFMSKSLQNSSANHFVIVSLWDGTVGSGTQVAGNTIMSASGSAEITGAMSAILTISTNKTYNVGFQTDGTGTATIAAPAVSPAYLMVELV